MKHIAFWLLAIFAVVWLALAAAPAIAGFLT